MAVLEIVGVHEAPGPAALLRRWWARHPETFAVARGPDGAIGAFVQVAEISGIDRSLIDDDPVAAAWCATCAAVPPRDGDRVLAMRRWLGRDSGEMLSPAVGSCWLDVKRIYMELRPRLSRLYSVMSDFDALAPIFVPLGFAPVGDPVDLGGAGSSPSGSISATAASTAGSPGWWTPSSPPPRRPCSPLPGGGAGRSRPREGGAGA